MSATRYSPWLKKQVYALLGVLAIILFSTSCLRAQTHSDHNYGIAVNGGYDVPVGNLNISFKTAVTYGFTVFANHGCFTTSISMGYQSYKPKLDTFYYQGNQSNYGTIVYQNFTALSMFLGGAYNLKLSKELKAYGGFNFGIYYTHSVYHSSGESADDNSDLHEDNLYWAPKVGINYSLSNNIDIGIEGKYNTFGTAGQKSENARIGAVYSSYAGNLMLTFNFR